MDCKESSQGKGGGIGIGEGDKGGRRGGEGERTKTEGRNYEIMMERKRRE